MTAEQPLEPTIPLEEDQEENDEGEESDVYEIEGEEEEGDTYEPEEVEDEEGDEDDEVTGDVEPENMTALLLGKQNGTTRNEEYNEEDDEEDEEYQEDGEGTAENPIDLSVVAGSKRSVDELAQERTNGDEEDGEDEGETVTKKARV